MKGDVGMIAFLTVTGKNKYWRTYETISCIISKFYLFSIPTYMDSYSQFTYPYMINVHMRKFLFNFGFLVKSHKTLGSVCLGEQFGTKE